MTFTYAIYFLGALTFATAVASGIIRIVDKLEGQA